MSDFHYTTTSTAGLESGIPTPIELKLEQDETGFNLSVKGTDGQQVTDAVSTVLRKMPSSKDTGLRDFLTGLALCTAFFTLVSLYTISSAPKLTPTPNTGELVK